jgi:hypothetical protein
MATKSPGIEMTKIKDRIKARNWVAKNNFNRPVRHRVATQYQRQPKHRQSNHDFSLIPTFYEEAQS